MNTILRVCVVALYAALLGGCSTSSLMLGPASMGQHFEAPDSGQNCEFSPRPCWENGPQDI